MRIKFGYKLLTTIFFVTIVGSFSVLDGGVLITSFDYTGELVFSDTDGASRYSIEGSDVLGGPWSYAWDYLTNIVATGSGIVTCTVPVTEPRMFFRVISMFDGLPDDMVIIIDGPFDMGDSFGESSSDELPVHTVDISTYYMDKTEVTWGKWQEVYNWAISHGYQFDNPGEGKEEDHPVHSVTWYDSAKWCNARSEMDGLEPCYYLDSTFETVYRQNTHDPFCYWDATGLRLPTEAEWEKASRGGLIGNRFSLGDTISHSNANYYVQHDSGVITFSYDEGPEIGYHPDYYYDGFPYTSPVATFTANAYGLSDMNGNVNEWCWDKYNEDYYEVSEVEDPTGSPSGYLRVYRGGCWINDAQLCRNADRDLFWPGSKDMRIGFRCVVGTKE